MADGVSGGWTRVDLRRHKSATYQLKLELRRLERTGRGDTYYADALRRVLHAFSARDMDAVIRLLRTEIDRMERDPKAGATCLGALRQAVSLIEPKERSDRQLFTYYLRRMEHEGRGNEPFARALRRALSNSDGPTLRDILTFSMPPSDGADS